MLEWSNEGGIATLAMEHGPVNTLDGEFLREMAETLRAIDAADVDALVLTGKGVAFSAGADLPRVLDGGEAYVRDSVDGLSDAFGALFRFRRPAIAAVNGHAIAGGCVLTCACDYRIMARDSGVIGISELKVGVPFPVWAFEIIRFSVAPHHLQELTYLAGNYKPEDALTKGLIDEVCDPDELITRATAVARDLASIPRRSFELMKQLVRRPTIERVERYGPEHDPQVQSLWTDDSVRESITAFMERIRARG